MFVGKRDKIEVKHVTFVMAPEAFRVTNVVDKAVGGMEYTILNVGYVMEQVHCNVVRATEPERESKRCVFWNSKAKVLPKVNLKVLLKVKMKGLSREEKREE